MAMIRRRRHHLALSLATVSAVLAATACSNTAPASNSQGREKLNSTVIPQAGSGLELAVTAVHDTAGSADSILVAVSVRNAGERQLFRNDPSWFYYEVIGPDGARLTREPRGAEPTALGGQPETILPRGGFVGQVVNLACAKTGFAQIPEASEDCAWRYFFVKDGNYRIVVSYSRPPRPDDSMAVGDGEMLRSDTATIVLATE
jgi:hypothetical protein